jgi:Leucine-rich repeat (LRR) protein
MSSRVLIQNRVGTQPRILDPNPSFVPLKTEILNVSSNSLTDTTFPTRFQSSVLTTLDASNNQLGAFNISLLTDLTNVRNLHMAGCAITSDLPANIDAMQSLVTLDLDANSITGTLPTTLGAIPTLSIIQLGTNLLTGTIPSELAQLQNLTVLELQTNWLTGDVPTELETLPNLAVFNVSGNPVNG